MDTESTIFMPGDVAHYTLNNGGQGVMRRLEINPLIVRAILPARARLSRSFSR